jgi:hypothetical protein
MRSLNYSFVATIEGEEQEKEGWLTIFEAVERFMKAEKAHSDISGIIFRNNPESALDSEHTLVELIDQHDISYNYSDDIHVWRNGQYEAKLIQDFVAEYVEDEIFIRLWNKIVQKKFGEGSPFERKMK